MSTPPLARCNYVSLGLFFVILGVGLTLSSGCDGRQNQAPASMYRLVDPTVPTARVKPTPVATIRDDTRYVLAAPGKALVFSGNASIANNRRLRVETTIPPRLRNTRHLLFVAKVKQGGVWHEVEPVALTMSTPGTNQRRVTVRFPLTAGLKPGSAKVNIVGYVLDMRKIHRWESRPVPVARGALLQFAFGVLGPAQHQGRVRFSIDACEDGQCETIFNEVWTPSAGKILGWQNRRMSLDDLAGRTPTFVFTTKVLNQQRGAFSLPVWANPTIYRPAPGRAQRPNVILFSVDTLRADHLTTYGYRYDTAPFIDETFGRGGVVFDSCVAAATTTTPSHMTMFTSLQPAAHHLKTGMEVLSSNIATLAERIRAAGIETGAVTEDGWLGIHHGFGRGFNVYVENKSANIMAPTGQVDVTLEKARRWLAVNSDKRFFLFLHTFQVHSPYAPPERYSELFKPARADESSAGAPPQHVLDMANYDREIRYTDDELRQFFDTLRELHLDDNTVFILVSDHGEEFLEHGHLEHGAQNYEQTTHVPLLVRGPGIARGKRIGVNVGHIDILPTILDLFGLEPPSYTDGKSLLPLLRGSADETLVETLKARPLFSESLSPFAVGPGRVPLPFDRPAYSVRIGKLKLHRYKIPSGFRYELYDLARDPGEEEDLWPNHGNQAEAMVALLDQYEAVSKAARSEAMRERLGGHPATADQDRTTHLDPKQEEKLRALGYLQ